MSRAIYESTTHPHPNYKITLKGDAVEGEGESVYQYIETAKDEEDPMCYVIGEVKWSSLSTGKFTRFISSKWGIVVLVIVPCATLLIYEVSKIVLILVKNKTRYKNRLFWTWASSQESFNN